VAIDEILRRSERRIVLLANTLNKFEALSEFVMHRLRAITPYVKAAASLRTVKAKRCDYEVTTGFKRSLRKLDVFLPVRVISKEMEHRSVVP
jgi:hypothetical protein